MLKILFAITLSAYNTGWLIMLYWIFRYELMSSCWKETPLMRPKFSKIASQLKSFLREVKVINDCIKKVSASSRSFTSRDYTYLSLYSSNVPFFSHSVHLLDLPIRPSIHPFIRSSIHPFIYSFNHPFIHKESIMFHLCPFLTSIHIQLLLTVLFNLLESQGLIRYSSNSLQRTYINITEDNNAVWWCFFMLKQTPRLIILIIRCRVHTVQYLK